MPRAGVLVGRLVRSRIAKSPGRAVKEFDLYVPLVSPDNVRYKNRQLAELKKQLMDRFGGLTHFPQKNKGLWRIGKSIFRDEIVILRVLAEDSANVRKFWHGLKADLEKEWNQEELLVVVRDVRLI